MDRHRRLRSRQARLRRTILGLGLVVAGGVAIGFAVDRHNSSDASANPTSTATSQAGSDAAAAGVAGVAPPPPVSSTSLSTSTTTSAATTAAPTTTSPAATTVAPTFAARALLGKIVAIDPGHNGDNFTDTSYIDHLIWNGREYETCDTTGTETDAGYTEALFNFTVANYLATDLEAEGAKIVFTRPTNSGVGPCVNERAAIGNNAHANAAISIHADGGPATGRGFTVLEPVADGVNDAIIGQSLTLGSDIRSALLRDAVEPVSDYYGTDGVQPRDDLGGLNLSTVPKVLVECANMRNQTDADLITSRVWQQQLARALAAGITGYLQTAPTS